MVATKGFMEFLGGTVTQSAANTFTEDDFSTPVGKSEELAMLIHKIRLEIGTTLDTPAQNDQIIIQLTRNSKDSIVNYNDKDLIAKYKKSFSVLTSGGEWLDHVLEINFNPPILFARSKIYCGVNTVGQGAVKDAKFQIGYTLEKVPEKQFIAALSD